MFAWQNCVCARAMRVRRDGEEIKALERSKIDGFGLLEEDDAMRWLSMLGVQDKATMRRRSLRIRASDEASINQNLLGAIKARFAPGKL
jgi:hypothetical protein